MNSRRSFFATLLVGLATTPLIAEARGGRGGGGRRAGVSGRRSGSAGYVGSGNDGGCGSKGGPGYRKANGKCASWRD